jgi:hypothetical protein
VYHVFIVSVTPAFLLYVYVSARCVVFFVLNQILIPSRFVRVVRFVLGSCDQLIMNEFFSGVGVLMPPHIPPLPPFILSPLISFIFSLHCFNLALFTNNHIFKFLTAVLLYIKAIFLSPFSTLYNACRHYWSRPAHWPGGCDVRAPSWPMRGGFTLPPPPPPPSCCYMRFHCEFSPRVRLAAIFTI